MESAASTVENFLFGNIDNTRTDVTTLSSCYPSDNTTNPNSFVAKAQSDGNRIGPSLTLRVMAGDTIRMAVSAAYNSTGADNRDATPNEIITALLQALSTNVISAGAHNALSNCGRI